MPRLITSSDRSSLIRLAHSLQAGSVEKKALLSKLAKIARVDFKPFTKTDWYGLAGAESFSDGSAPLIGYFENLRMVPFNDSDGNPDLAFNSGMIVVDRNGISVMFTNEDGEGVDFASQAGIDDPIKARQVADAVAKMVERGKLPSGMKKVNDDRGRDW